MCKVEGKEWCIDCENAFIVLHALYLVTLFFAWFIP